MIKVDKLFRSLCEYAKDYVSGMDPVQEFNRKINESQKEIADAIFTLYDKNERVRTLVTPFIKSAQGTASGLIPNPPDFHRALSIRVTVGGKDLVLYYAKDNELIEQSFIPQRKADFSKGIGYYTNLNDSIKIIPADSVEYRMTYLRNPSDVDLIHSYVPNGFGQVSIIDSSSTDLEWNDNAFNLILNWLLFKYGVLNRDQFLTEVSGYGITSDLINTQ